MEKLRLMIDFLNGPVWKDRFINPAAPSCTGIDIVDNAPIVRMLDDKIQDMYCPLYSFEGDAAPCTFDEERLHQMKDEFLDLMKKLNERLAEINDGSFEVEDLVTPFFELS